MREPKKFATYEQQIAHLRQKGLFISDTPTAVQRLQEYGYYPLVSAYKSIFLERKNGKYVDGTAFEHIESLYYFDESLRSLFLMNILYIENKLKSLYSYSFCELFGGYQADYLNEENYNYNCLKYQGEIDRLLSKLRHKINLPKEEYLKYSFQEYGEIPLWVLMRVLTFGTSSKMIEVARPELRNAVAQAWGSDEIYEKQLVKMLKVLTYFRNVCAHGERLYNYKIQGSILDMKIHQDLEIAFSGSMYKQGKSDVFAVMICFRYLLSPMRLLIFENAFFKTMSTLRKDIPPHVYNQVEKEMGLPYNWRRLFPWTEEYAAKMVD